MSTSRPRLRRVGVIASLAVAVATGVTACSNDSGDSHASASRSDKFDQALHDKLPKEIRDSGKIVVGGAFESLPLLNANPADATKPVGVAPLLTKAMSEVLGVNMEFKNTAFPGQLPGLQSGTLDVLMGQISDTAVREKTIADMVPWYISHLGVALPADNPNHITSDLGSLCGLKTAIVAGAFFKPMLEGASHKYCTSQGKPAIKLAEFGDASGGFTSVRSGQNDLYFESALSTRDLAKDSGGALKAIEMDYEQTKEYDAGLYGIAVSKDNPGLTEAILGAFKAIEADGTVADALAKYDAKQGAVPKDEITINPLTKTPVGTSAG